MKHMLLEMMTMITSTEQKLTPQKQLELGEYYGRVEKHPQAPQVNGLPGVTVIWQNYFEHIFGRRRTFKNNNYANFDNSRNYPGGGTQVMHTDLVHEKRPAGITHLHLDTVPDVGSDTFWFSGYAAYDKLSEEFKKFLDGKQAVQLSLHKYLDRDDPFGGPKNVERVHPVVRTHPTTGWKALYVNRGHTTRILGVSPVESDIILKYLFDIYEKNADIQVRFKWGPQKPGYGVSALWDNRVTQHKSVFDAEGRAARHGTRVTALAEIPFLDPNSKSQREALGLPLDE
ncbi:unnamed protein product [Ambrosiozyma monospora]|uniref:Unnamed protein product n=1 Tax=Ambrosiozyma monospora TaxID=43982 RepID=A0ACB5SV11_AMBMO|nr:unnamed protein product [Ambrosiozyma monospora]